MGPYSLPGPVPSPSLDTPQRPGSRWLTNFINRETGPKGLDYHPQSQSCRRLSQGSNPEPELSATLLPAGPSRGHHVPPPTLWHFHSLCPSSEISNAIFRGSSDSYLRVAKKDLKRILRDIGQEAILVTGWGVLGINRKVTHTFTGVNSCSHTFAHTGLSHGIHTSSQAHAQNSYLCTLPHMYMCAHTRHSHTHAEPWLGTATRRAVGRRAVGIGQ